MKADEQQKTFNFALAHHLKDTLSMVQATAGQTFKEVTKREAVKVLSRTRSPAPMAANISEVICTVTGKINS